MCVRDPESRHEKAQYRAIGAWDLFGAFVLLPIDGFMGLCSEVGQVKVNL